MRTTKNLVDDIFRLFLTQQSESERRSGIDSQASLREKLLVLIEDFVAEQIR